MDRESFIKNQQKLQNGRQAVERFIFVFALTCLTIVAPTISAQQQPEKNININTMDMATIERQILTSSGSLNDLERKIVHHLQENPRNAKDHYLLASLYTQEFLQNPQDWAKLKTATDLAQQTIDLCPTCDYGYVISSRILDLMGESRRAMDLLKSVKKIYGRSSWRISFQEARLAAELDSPSASLKVLESALAVADANREVMLPFLIALLESEYLDEELESALIYWHQQYPSELFQVALAEHYTRLGQFGLAHDIYSKLIKERGPSNSDMVLAEIVLADAVLLYEHLNNPKQAITMLNSLLNSSQKPGHLSQAQDPTNQQAYLVHFANAHLASGDQVKAKELYLKAFAIAPVSDEALLPLRKIMQHPKQQSPVSNELFATLLDHIPGRSILWAILAENYSKDFKHTEATKAFSNAIILEPSNSNYYVGLGIEFYHLKRFEQALALFTTASSLDPSHAVARYNQACMQSLLGRSEEALGNLREALALDPSLKETARNDHDLANLSSHSSYQELIDAKPVTHNHLTH